MTCEYVFLMPNITININILSEFVVILRYFTLVPISDGVSRIFVRSTAAAFQSALHSAACPPACAYS